MKRTVTMADLAPYAALFLDIAAWAPDLRPSLNRDFDRLYRVVSTRGLSFILLDLPEAGKVFDFSLSRGTIDFSALPKSFGKVSSGREYFMQQLLYRVFTSDGRLLPFPCITSIDFIRQVFYLAKKVVIPCPNKAVVEAVHEFIQIEESMRRPTLSWDLDDLGHPEHELSLLDGYRYCSDLISHRDTVPRPALRVLEAVSDIVVSTMPKFDPLSILPGHGPGAVSDVRSGEDKYLFRSWPVKLDNTFSFEYFSQSREDLHLGDRKRALSSSESFSRLCAVPKTYKGPRLITIEPVAHQYIQQGVLMWLRDNFPKLLSSSINFKRQDLSMEAALAASKSRTIATVDLSSASDRLSCWLIERIFRKNYGVLRALHACRTRGIKVVQLEQPHYLMMRKYAGQGNATTFPVQSIVYCLVAIAAVLYESGRKPSLSTIKSAASQIRVFGDDIILPSSAATVLMQLLSHLGLKVNMTKSHVQGGFRESCGMDAYDGVCVTPVYISALALGSRPSDLVSWIDVSNNAYRKGLWHLADWMVGQIPSSKRKLVPVSNRSLGCLTLASYQDCLVSSKRRTNTTLFRDEILALQVTNKTVTKQRGEYEALLQYFLEASLPDVFGVLPKWKAGYFVRSRTLLKVRWVPA